VLVKLGLSVHLVDWMSSRKTISCLCFQVPQVLLRWHQRSA